MTTIKELFNIDYGQGEYHSKEHLDPGDGFLISSQGVDNGCYGFFNVPSKYAPPLITIPSTWSIGEAFVQTNFCSVDDNCLVLEPKQKLPLDYLFYVATGTGGHNFSASYVEHEQQVAVYRKSVSVSDTEAKR